MFAIRVRKARRSSADLIPNQTQCFVRETRTGTEFGTALDPTKTGGSVPPRTVVRDEIPTGTESKDRREGGFHRAVFVGCRQLNRSNFFHFVWYKVSDRTPCVKGCALKSRRKVITRRDQHALVRNKLMYYRTIGRY